MSARPGPVALGHKEELIFLGREIGEQKNYSEKIAEAIDEEIRALIDHAYNVAKDILTKHRDKLVQLAERLIKEETLEGDALEQVFSSPPSPKPRVKPELAAAS